MKLEELLGADLYAQVKAKLDEKNANEPDKLKHIRYADLSEGEYVGKAKYDSETEKLNNLIANKDTEITNANNLIAELKKASKGNEDIQKKVAEYETANAKLQEELRETKLRSAIKVALLSEKAVDVDYLTFKLNEKMKEKNEKLELDENDNIKDWNDKASELKVQFPAMFESASPSGRTVIENKLEKPEDYSSFTKADILKMSYAKRAEFASEHPEAYNAAMSSEK